MIANRIVQASSQRGAALIAVIFLIVVIASLGAFAIRTGGDYMQQANLALQEVRVEAAAYGGLEYAANRLNAGAACPAVVPFPAGTPGMNGITVRLNCPLPLNTGVGIVRDITATASYSVFGRSDFVQRVRTRRVSSVGTGSW